MRLGSTVLAVFLTAGLATAGVEAVIVRKVMDDKAIVVRSSGGTFLIEKGVGCLSLWRFEGKRVYIDSPGLFLGVGSRLLLPDADQECRIWNSEALRSTSPRVLPAPPSPPRLSPSGPASSTTVLQRALRIIGYDVPLDGILGEPTKGALSRYRESMGHPNTETGLKTTLLSLAIDVLSKQPPPPDALQIAEQLAAAAKGGSGVTPSSGCDAGHWISTVTSGGKLIKLEDGSLWQVDPVDAIDSMLWLPTEDILICGQMLINTDTGEKVKATKLK